MLFLLVLFPCVRAFADDERSVISIENAQKTEYKKDVVTGADTIVLTGGVRISVSRGGSKSTIFADMVNYNRETDMMYAEGNVQLEQTGTKAGEAQSAHQCRGQQPGTECQGLSSCRCCPKSGQRRPQRSTPRGEP